MTRPKRVFNPNLRKGGWKMKTSAAGIVAAALLLGITGIGYGIAQAGETDRNVEALDSFYEYQPENRPVLSFEDQGLPQIAESPSGDMQLSNPVEAGRLPAESDTDTSSFEAGGIGYRPGVDTGP